MKLLKLANRGYKATEIASTVSAFGTGDLEPVVCVHFVGEYNYRAEFSLTEAESLKADLERLIANLKQKRELKKEELKALVASFAPPAPAVEAA